MELGIILLLIGAVLEGLWANRIHRKSKPYTIRMGNGLKRFVASGDPQTRTEVYGK